MTTLKNTGLKVVVLLQNIFGQITIKTAMNPKAGEILFDETFEEISRRYKDDGWVIVPDHKGDRMGICSHNDGTIRLISSSVLA